MPFQLICASHGPALTRPHPVPRQHAEIEAVYARRAEALKTFDPELIIMFGPDHFTNIHLCAVPPFMIGGECEAVADYGGFGGRFDVPTQIAKDCLAFVRARGFDLAYSHRMLVDHGFSQPLHRLAGSIDAVPTLPIFINTTCWPPSSFRRVRELGETVGAFAKGLGKRVTFLASGGLSHHPANIFPQNLAEAAPAVRDYLLFGGRTGGMNALDWHRHLGEQTELGGESVARGERTAQDFRLNPEWDKRFLDLAQKGDYSVFDDWSPDDVIAQAGVAAMEVQHWIAAGAAAKAAGIGPAQVDYYAPVVEYRIAVGVMHAD